MTSLFKLKAKNKLCMIWYSTWKDDTVFLPVSLCFFPLPKAPSTPMATRPSSRGNHGDPAFHV